MRPPPRRLCQQAGAHSSGATSLAVTPPAAVTSGNRLIVEAAVWNSSGATTGSVVDSAGNTYIELTHFAASDGTEMSVWTAPVTVAGQPARRSPHRRRLADMGMRRAGVLGPVDGGRRHRCRPGAHAGGKTVAAASVTLGSDPTDHGPPTSWRSGFYADSGFGDTLSAGSGFTRPGQHLAHR